MSDPDDRWHSPWAIWHWPLETWFGVIGTVLLVQLAMVLFTSLFAEF